MRRFKLTLMAAVAILASGCREKPSDHVMDVAETETTPEGHLEDIEFEAMVEAVSVTTEGMAQAPAAVQAAETETTLDGPSKDTIEPLPEPTAEVRELALGTWIGFVVIWKDESGYHATVVYPGMDRDFFRRDRFHSDLIKLGMPLHKQEGNRGPRENLWEAIFDIPSTVRGTISMGQGRAALPNPTPYMKVMIDSEGNVFYWARSYPRGACGGPQMILGVRKRLVGLSGYDEAMLYSPSKMNGLVIHGSYAGFNCTQ